MKTYAAVQTLRAVRFLYKGPVILALLFAINLTVAHGHWFRWAALGILIAWVISAVRVLRAVVLAGGIAALLTYLHRSRTS